MSRLSRTTWLTRAGVVLLSGTAAAGALAAPAQAASTGRASITFGIFGPVIVVEAGSGKTNKIVITKSGNKVTIDDRVTVKAGEGCTAVKGDKTKVTCTDPKPIARVRVELGSGNDSVTNRTAVPLTALGGSGNDTIRGGSGRDKLYGGTGRDKIWGLGGIDALYGGDGNDSLSGGADGDWLEGGKGDDKEYGGSGRDRFGQADRGKATDADVVSGGSGFDTVEYGGKRGITADSDRGKRDDGRKGEHDTLLGLESFYGTDGNDKIYGDDGPNLLVGFNGDDLLVGNGGDDWLRDYSTGDDRLHGGTGNDRMEGGIGADVILGGSGVDTVSYSGHKGAITVDLDGAKGDDGMRGEKDTVGADIENIIGTDFADVLTGNGSANQIEGWSGDDAIRGGGGNDVLVGNYGADRIYGEAGDDALASGHPTLSSDASVDLLDGGAGNDNALAGTDPQDTVLNSEYSQQFTLPAFDENIYF
ncbi:calcium-binding protein [Actinoplanes derwentensis]|uniref:Ca2+-binding protein, RTX toxin-related n=1 Tax=Actinoplanes derwentensis TaxID=113562 RepID=A0A1H2CXW5_9ACTN|nr:calcium-binding protein [Actinoplanes derwentensis]GID82845.1 hypothetical protein Ade03nite_17690 [Actinoplanes derwentensis]SDT75204.1 Ca2+-binding protein, RTX toxin-related [Actinoplanes derwentensis]